MKLEIGKELNELNELFLKHNTSLYIVGGFVRDSLLLLNPTDVDLASKLKNEELFELLKNSAFTVQQGSKKLGTSIIEKDKSAFEHTTFRKEVYLKGGFHTPKEVSFISDIELDAKRRDFTVNSLYYDLKNHKILDFFNGLEDLKQKSIKAIVSPQFVFQSDGLRILRMIRLAGELGFSIDKKTFEVAKEMVHQLNDISKDRLYKEFQLILLSNKKYHNNTQVHLEQFFELGALDYIFKNLQTYKSKQKLRTLKTKNLYYFLLKNNPCPFQSFYLDIAIILSEYENKKPSVILSKLLSLDGCGISKKEQQDTLTFVKAYEQVKKINTDKKVRVFIQDHINIIDQLLFILNNENDKAYYEILNKNYQYMKEHKMPFSLKELAINGIELQEELKLEDKKQIGVLLKQALKFCTLEKNNNTKAHIVAYLKKQRKEK